MEYNFYDKIYNQIYLNLERKKIEIFLCGGASTKNKISYRDKLKDYILSKEVGNIRILYPEKLFMEILNTNDKANLLHLEQYLAEHSDVICIICESPGSLVELGAFSSTKILNEKLLICIEEKYKKAKSFINMGPVKKIIIENSKESIHYYDDKGEIENTYKHLLKFIKEQKRERKKEMPRELNTIVSIYYFLQILLFFIQKINFKQISDYLKKKNEKFDTHVLNSALKLLFIENILKKDEDNYMLTTKGYSQSKEMLQVDSKEFKSKNLNALRLEYLNMLYYSPHGKKS